MKLASGLCPFRHWVLPGGELCLTPTADLASAEAITDSYELSQGLEIVQKKCASRTAAFQNHMDY